MTSVTVVGDLNGIPLMLTLDTPALEAIASALDVRRDAAPQWLTLEQAAVRLGCSYDAVRMRVQRGRLEVKRSGRRLYVSRRSIDAA